MIAALLLALASGVPQGADRAAVRTAEPQSTATATIRGRVTDRDTGQPLPRFRVSVSKQLLSDERSETIATAIADSNGQYELSVRPGTYVITARPPELVFTHLPEIFGYDSALSASGSFRLAITDVKQNGRLEANFTVRRSLAIEGRIATPEGDPLAGVLVSLERADRRVTRPAVETDDRGYYRHFGLSPGRYRLCVAPAPPAPVKGPPGSVAPASSHLLTTCYPAESESASGRAIELASADVRDVDIVMRTLRRFTVSGELQDSAGGPLDIGVVSFVEDNARPRRSLAVKRIRPGRFLIEGAEPGTYALRVDVAADAATGRPREYASTEIVVGKDDVGGVVLRMRRPATVAGAVTFEGAAPASGLERMAVTIQRESAPGTDPVAPTSRLVRENLTFDLAASPEPARLGLNHTPPGWIVKAILYLGRDVTDEPVVLESTNDSRALEIVVTNRVVYITGNTAGTSRGRPVVVLAFHVDKGGFAARPDASGGSSLPVTASAAADEKGAFTVGPLAPGEYLVAAVDRDMWFDASLENRAAAIDRILPRAERVTAREGEQPSMSLRLVPVR